MMLGRLYSRISACLVVLVLLITAREANAQFQLRLEQSGFPSKTVIDNGPFDLNAAVGRITVTGAYGTFNINITTGLSKPAIGNGTSQASIDLNSTDFSTAAGGTLYLTLADTDFNFPNNNAGNQMALTAQVGGTMAGQGINPIPAGSSIIFGSWVNVTNVSPLATDPTTIPGGSVAVAPMGPFGTSTYSANTPAVNFTKGAGPYSMFTQAVITMTGAGRTGFDLATIVAGQNCSGKLGNYVWNDLNHNGVQEFGEPGIPGITINLSKDGNASATTTTDASGFYQFTGLCAASYTVEVPSQPGLTGYVASPTLQGGDFSTDSNPNPTTVLFANDNENDQTIDFGYYIPAPHLTLVKDPKGAVFTQGAPVSFNFKVGNDGGSAATNVMLNDQLPGNGGLQWMIAAGNPSQGSCTISGTNFLSCNLGTIQPTQFVTLTITSVGPSTPFAACQAQPNPIALATADGGLSAQDSGSWDCVPPQLSIVKTPKGGTFAQGAAISFTIVVSNPAPAGASPAANVMLTDSLPGNGGLVWDSATSTQGACTLTSNNLSCALGSIAAGASVTVTVNSTATTPLDACQLQPNPMARATADGGLDVQDSGSLDCVRPPAELGIVKSPKNGIFAQGAQISFTIQVINPAPAGSSDATNVTLDDALPGNGGLVWATATTTQGSCSIAGNNLSCALGSIAAGATVTVTVTSTPTTPLEACQLQPNPSALATADGGLRAEDFGSYNCTPPASLGDFVWHDLNADGVQDVGEPGIAGVTVTLLKCDGTPTGMTMLTDATGFYKFTNLTPDCYKVQFAAPAGFTPTLPNQGSNDAADSDAVGGLTGNYTLNAGDNNLTVDAGFYKPASLGDFVWKDLDLDGVQDAGEPGIPGVAVTLLKCDGTPTGMTATTNASGLYLFPNLTPGCYKVQFATPAGYTPSPANQGSNDALDSDSVSGLTGNYTLNSGDNNLTVDAGFYQVPPLTAACAATVTGKVGVAYSSAIIATGGTAPYTFTLNSGTLPVGLFLNPSTGAITGTPTTAGGFAFTVKVTDSTGTGALTAITSNCGITIAPPTMTATCVAAAVGQVGVPYSSSIGVIGGTAPYTFALASGSLPGGLSLNPATGAVTGTPTTAGPFSFSVMVTDSTPGVHAVATTSNCGITIAPPPPPGPCVPSTFTFTGNTSTSGTAGNLRTFTVNGISVKASAFSRTDSGGAWATAFLGLYGPGLGVTDGSEGSGSNNSHKVDNIGGRDNYVLFEFSSPVTVDRAFLDYIGGDSDLSVWIGTKTDPFNNHLTLSDSVLSSLTYDEDQTSSTSSSRWADINGGAVSGNVLVIAALANDTTPEDEFKISKLDISCPQAPPTCSGKIGDFVWKDTNNNGVQDSGEPGIPGVPVQLKNGSTVIATATTDSLGKYQFTGLCAGTYTVVIPTVPSGYTASSSLAGTNRSIDSNGSPATVTLAANDSSDQTIDFGFVPVTPPAPCVARTFTFTGNSSTSGTAGNIQTFTANGVSVKASAFSRVDSNGAWATAYLGVYGPGLGVTDGSEGTGANPKHKVDNIGGRDNYVLFEFSSPVIVNRAFLDSLGNDSDVSVWIGTRTDPFNNHLTLSDSLLSSLTYDEDQTSSTPSSRWADVNSGSVSGNVLVIAALANDTTPEDEFKISKIETQCPPTTSCSGTIGDFVWNDSNGNGIQNSGDLGISGVTVQLKKNGTVVATTTTNASGFYQFTGLCAGTYSVVIPNTPTGKVASPAAVGSDRTIDSNGSPASVTLSTNSSTDLTVDFGFVGQAPACPNTRFTFTGNSSSSGTAGNTRTFTVNGISVKVTAFSRTSGGTWASAYLGLYGPGLGVTDGGEGNGSDGDHKVDNQGRLNFVLFEFSAPVVVNQAFLDAIGSDADLSIFIGNKSDPFNNHLTLSDSLMGSLTHEENQTSSTGTSRWADFNSASQSGNVLVLAAMVTDTTPEDEFKISKLDVTCP